MLSASRALSLNIESSPKMPRVPALDPLYQIGVVPRKGQFMMVAGRSGSQKSGFALWWAAQMNVPTLYFSADMSGYTASLRLACMRLDIETEYAERLWKRPEGRAEISEALDELNITFSFGPIHWRGVDDELSAYIELHDAFPEMMVFDNLMDIEGCQSGYAEQMEAMQSLSDLSRATGSTVLVLHHATDAQGEGHGDPFSPPARYAIKNKLAEKPETVLGIGLNPMDEHFKIAPLKNREGRQDLTGNTWVSLRAHPAKTQFTTWVPPQSHGFASQS